MDVLPQILTICQTARKLEEEGDDEGAEAKYREALEAAKHLPAADRTTTALAYELTIFYAHNENTKNADEVWDGLTEQFTQRWGNGHEQTIEHYELVGCLLSVWDRHENSLNILRLLAIWYWS